MFFLTTGDDGSRQVPSDAASFVRVFEKVIFMFESTNICNGKTMGLAILVLILVLLTAFQYVSASLLVKPLVFQQIPLSE